MVDMSDLYIVLITLVFSAFFSGMEIAFISANKLQIEVQAKDNNIISKILSGFVHNQARFLIAIIFCQESSSGLYFLPTSVTVGLLS